MKLCSLNLLIALAAVWSSASFAQDLISCQSDDPGALRIAVVSRRDAVEGASHYRGVAEACREHEASGTGRAVNLTPYVYDDDTEGFAQVSRIVAERRSHVILGPTDSGVFADIVDFLYQPADQSDAEVVPVPIISSLVTVDVGNDPDGWFFRTNVDAVSRAQRIYEFLADRGVQNIAVLYADRTFGEIAETAFRGELSDVQRAQFFSARFRTDESGKTHATYPASLREAVRLVLARRPGAIGVFGTREEVNRARELVTRLHYEWNAYNPYVFTIVDARSTAAENLYFLSVRKPTPVNAASTDDEVMGLAYDTTTLVLRIADQMELMPTNSDWGEQFRKRWAGLLSGSRASPGQRTGMVFDGMRNQTTPQVMTLSEGQIQLVANDVSGPWWQPIMQWIEVRQRRFGEAPVLNLIIIASIVALLTIVDLKRSHSVPGLDFLHPTFLLLIVFNMTIACLVFVILAEQDVLGWDQEFGALLVAFGYSGLLKTTIFESEAGQSFGAKRYYSQLVQWIYDRIRRRKFEQDGPAINLIAFRNSRTYLKRSLEESYSFARNEARKQSLMDKLESVVNNETTTLGKRQVYARVVLDELRWRKMIERRIVPRNSTRHTVQDPEPVVDDAVTHCLRSGSQDLDAVEILVRHDLHMRRNEAPENAQLEVEAEFDEELSEATTPRSQLGTCVRWLILLRGLDLQWLVDNDYLPDGYLQVRPPTRFLDRWRRGEPPSPIQRTPAADRSDAGRAGERIAHQPGVTVEMDAADADDEESVKSVPE